MSNVSKTLSVRLPGVRKSIPQGYVLGRSSSGTGDIELIPAPGLTLGRGAGSGAGPSSLMGVGSALRWTTPRELTLVGDASGSVLIDGSSDVTMTVTVSGGGGGGDVERIAQVITSGSQSTVDFSSIPATFTDLRLSIVGRGSDSAADVVVNAQFNADTGNNYDSFNENKFNSTQTFATSSIRVGDLAGSSVTTNMPMQSEVNIPYYSNTIFFKSLTSVGGSNDGSNMYMDKTAGFWHNTAAINEIKLSLSAGNFVDGSIVTLWGYK